MKRTMRRPSASLTISVVALIVAIGGGGQAVAGGVAKLITGKQVKDGSLTLKDFAKGDRAKLRGAAGPAGAPGPQGAAGQKGDTGSTGPQGSPGTVRAYGVVSSAGVLNAAMSKNIAAVTSPGTGVFCVRLAAGIDASTVAPVATLDYGDSAPASTVEVAVGATHCPGVTNAVEVTTGRVISHADGVLAGESAADAGFSVLVP